MRPDPFLMGQSPNFKLDVRMDLGYTRLIQSGQNDSSGHVNVIKWD